MRIAHTIASLERRHGGPSRSVRALGEAQASLGYSVSLVATGPEMHESCEGLLSIQVLQRRWPTLIARADGFTEALHSTEPSVIHAHGLWLRPLHYSRLVAEAKQVPLVIAPRGMMSGWSWQHHRLRKRLSARWVHPHAFEAAAGWHATSREEAREIENHGFLQPICVAPNGVRVPGEDELARAREHWENLCPTILQKRTAVFYSRFHAKKRVLELIDLWLDCAPHDWLLLLVGIPEQYSVGELSEYVYRSGGSGRIAVFDGANRPAPYAAASLCLLPSHSENFGLVVAEALVAGIPALVTDSTPWKGLTEHEAGWCVPWSDYGPVLKQALSESPATLAERGARARDWAGRAFSWDNTARILARFYEQLISASR